MQPPPKPNVKLILRIPSLNNLRIGSPVKLVLELIGIALPCMIRCFVADGPLALGHEEVEEGVLGGGELVVWGCLGDWGDYVGLWLGLWELLGLGLEEAAGHGDERGLVVWLLLDWGCLGHGSCHGGLWVLWQREVWLEGAGQDGHGVRAIELLLDLWCVCYRSGGVGLLSRQLW